MNKIKNIAHVTNSYTLRVYVCQSLVGFVTVFCLVHIMSHFFQGNLWQCRREGGGGGGVRGYTTSGPAAQRGPRDP